MPGVAIERAVDALDEDLREAILIAAAQVRVVAEALLPDDRRRSRCPSARGSTVRQVPVDAAGVYVPGGRAAYPSSLIMGVVPAQVAGVERVAVVSPPGRGRHGRRRSSSRRRGCSASTRCTRSGEPAAIAALAYGTATIPPVAVIVGPGSPWVQEAKRQVVGIVGIDGVAGPSEVMVIADASGRSRRRSPWTCSAQAEHGADSPAILRRTTPR